MKTAYVGRFPLGTKDFSEQLNSAKAAGANVLFALTVGPESAAIARGRQAMNWKVTQVAAWTLSFPFFLDGSGKEATEGALTAQSFIAEPSNERRASFLTSYARKFNVSKIPVPMVAAQGYDSVYVLIYSLFGLRNGNFSGPVVKTALDTRSRTYYGVVATYGHPFSKQHKEATTQNMLVMGQVKKGQSPSLIRKTPNAIFLCSASNRKIHASGPQSEPGNCSVAFKAWYLLTFSGFFEQ